MNDLLPSWIEPAQLAAWPTQPVQSSQLHYSLSVPKRWTLEPGVNQTALEIEQIFWGVYSGEYLTVSFMNHADSTSNLRNWVEVLVKLTGFPIWVRQTGDTHPELLEWQYQGNCEPLTQRLKVDETHLYQGLAKLPEMPATLARFYILLARRNHFAWKVCLSLSSACLPGTSEEVITANDHCRAGATFGSLHFL